MQEAKSWSSEENSVEITYDINEMLNDGWKIIHIISRPVSVSTGASYGLKKKGDIIIIFEKLEEIPGL